MKKILFPLIIVVSLLILPLIGCGGGSGGENDFGLKDYAGIYQSSLVLQSSNCARAGENATGDLYVSQDKNIIVIEFGGPVPLTGVVGANGFVASTEYWLPNEDGNCLRELSLVANEVEPDNTHLLALTFTITIKTCDYRTIPCSSTLIGNALLIEQDEEQKQLETYFPK